MMNTKIIEKNNMRIAIMRSDSYIRISEIDSSKHEVFGSHIDIYGGERHGEQTKWKISWASGGEEFSPVKNHITLLKLAMTIANKENKKLKL